MSFAKAGEVWCGAADFRAHIQYREKGKNSHIYGPHRQRRDDAQNDLEAIRLAANPFPDSREEALEAMRKEAQRLKDLAQAARDAEDYRYKGS